MDNKLQRVLDRLKNRLTYKKLDSDALDISRACASGSIGKKDDYLEWALISNDPLVVVNYVKTFINTLVAKLSSAPYRPENDQLADIGVALRANARFVDNYNDVLADGYSFLGIGMDLGTPQLRAIDARYILFNGEDPTLRDATDVVIFQIVPKDPKDVTHKFDSFPTGYVDYDMNDERVITSHYHKETKKDDDTGEEVDVFVLDVYDYYDEEPTRYELKGLDRIPVVRFVGERIELSDKRYHYRGLYFQMASVLKALTLAGTKVQIRAAASDDDNYFVPDAAIDNHREHWKNSGAKPYDDTDDNGGEIKPPTPIPHDNEFLLNTFNLWKNVISDMLGPVVQSGSEAVTREEVIARNEVRDAITNIYMTRMADSIAEVYRCINMFMYGDNSTVVILGGYIEQVKRTKDLQELGLVYEKAKEAGLNTTGFVKKFLEFTDLPTDTKTELEQTLEQDPFASPKMKGMQVQLQQKDEQIRKLQFEKAILQLKASTRAEHQNDYINQLKENHDSDIRLKQWTQEDKATTDARMAILNKALDMGDMATALAMLAKIEAVAPMDIATVGGEGAPEMTPPPLDGTDTTRINQALQVNQPQPTPPQPGVI